MRVLTLLLLPLLLTACKRRIRPEIVDRDVSLPENSRPWKIASARSAGPVDVVKDALIQDVARNDTTRGEDLVLGANGWTCWPDNPGTPADDPLCLDAGGREWQYAMQARRAPRIATIGMMYRLRGDGEVGAHVGIIPGNQRLLNGLPTTPQVDKAWVRYAGTPWAYLVVPARKSP